MKLGLTQAPRVDKSHTQNFPQIFSNKILDKKFFFSLKIVSKLKILHLIFPGEGHLTPISVAAIPYP